MLYFTPGNSSAEEIIATHKKPSGTVIGKIKSEYPQSHIKIKKEIPVHTEENASYTFSEPEKKTKGLGKSIIKNALLVLMLYLFAVRVSGITAPDYIGEMFEKAFVTVNGIGEDVLALAESKFTNSLNTSIWNEEFDMLNTFSNNKQENTSNYGAVENQSEISINNGATISNKTNETISAEKEPYIMKYISVISNKTDEKASEQSKQVISGDSDSFSETIKRDLSRSSDRIYLQNETTLSPDVNAMAVSAYPIENISEQSEPQVLILHTHGTESYSDSSTGVSRSTNTNENVVRVGEELANVLRFYGISTIHSKTMHDKDSYITSYQSSRKEAQKILAENPGIKYVIDLHRDALPTENGHSVKTYTEIDGKGAAQIMFVIGTNAGGGNHPEYEKNLTVAAHIQEGILNVYPGLARPINLRSAIFNQNVCSGSLLVEVGSDANTLEEAITAVKYFGEVFARVVMGES